MQPKHTKHICMYRSGEIGFTPWAKCRCAVQKIASPFIVVVVVGINTQTHTHRLRSHRLAAANYLFPKTLCNTIVASRLLLLLWLLKDIDFASPHSIGPTRWTSCPIIITIARSLPLPLPPPRPPLHLQNPLVYTYSKPQPYLHICELNYYYYYNTWSRGASPFCRCSCSPFCAYIVYGVWWKTPFSNHTTHIYTHL